MRRLSWILILPVFILPLACGEEGGEDVKVTEDAEPVKTPEEFAQERAPLAVETTNELLGAVQTGDKARILAMCFEDITVVSEKLDLTGEEIAGARAQQAAQLELFEAFWTDMVLSGAYVIKDWSEPVVMDIAPAEGNPDLIVYMTQTDVTYVLNGEELAEAGKAVVVFNLYDDWFVQWPY